MQFNPKCHFQSVRLGEFNDLLMTFLSRTIRDPELYSGTLSTLSPAEGWELAKQCRKDSPIYCIPSYSQYASVFFLVSFWDIFCTRRIQKKNHLGKPFIPVAKQWGLFCFFLAYFSLLKGKGLELRSTFRPALIYLLSPESSSLLILGATPLIRV